MSPPVTESRNDEYNPKQQAKEKQKVAELWNIL